MAISVSMTLFLPVTNSNSVDPSCAAMSSCSLRATALHASRSFTFTPKLPRVPNHMYSHVICHCLGNVAFIWSWCRRIMWKQHPSSASAGIASLSQPFYHNAHEQTQPCPLPEWSPPGYTAVPTHSDQLATTFSANLIRYPCECQQPFCN